MKMKYSKTMNIRTNEPSDDSTCGWLNLLIIDTYNIYHYLLNKKNKHVLSNMFISLQNLSMYVVWYMYV